MFRRLSLIAAACVCAAILPSCPDANALTLDRMAVTLVADSIHVRVPVALPTGADSARITLTLTPGGNATFTASAFASAVTFAFAAPAEGATVTIRACGTAYKKGVAGPSSCNTQQSYTRPIVPPGAVTWPDSMTISQMQWPDSASVALIRQAWGNALPLGDLAVLHNGDTVAVGEWANLAGFLLARPVGTCDAGCTAAFLTDALSPVARMNWEDTRWVASTLATNGTYRGWWDQVKACGGCTVMLPFDGTLPGAKI